MKRLLQLILPLFLITACHKEFLEERTNKSIVVPQTLQDFQALLDNTLMNIGEFNSTLSDGDFLLTDAAIPSQTNINRNTYFWSADTYEGTTIAPAWDRPYQQILYANIVLEGLDSFSPTVNEQADFDRIKGSALFYRAIAYHILVQNFAVPYQAATAANMPGVPLRLYSEINTIQPRASLQACYDQIIDDLQQAIPLLPIEAQVITRPNTAAAHALLARVYLNMGNYTNALTAARDCLQLRNELLDYNEVVPVGALTFANPFAVPNPEILFYQRSNTNIVSNANFRLDQDFFDSYTENDRRKILFFNSNRNFIGRYTSTNFSFNGLATDEVYLIAAECEARLGNASNALAALNTLAANRYTGEGDAPFAETEPEALLRLILVERRKELVTRSRWEDLRRLNLDVRFQVTLTRTYLGQTYSLPPNSSRYVFAIPGGEGNYSGIEQNVRTENE